MKRILLQTSYWAKMRSRQMLRARHLKD